MPRPQLSSTDHPTAARFLLRLYEFIASLGLAVLVISVSVAVLAWATFVESWYGTEAVHFGIYGTWWFSALTALLGVNVLAAALIRFPWKKRQIGFLITHAGIVALLVGCLLSRTGGIDAQLPVFEGHTGYVAFEDTQHFQLTIDRRDSDESADENEPPPMLEPGIDIDDPNVEIVRIPFAAGPFNWQDYRRKLSWLPWRLARRDRGVVYDRDGVKLDVLDYCSDSRLVAGKPIKPVPFAKKKSTIPQPRVHLRLSVDGSSEQFWLEGMQSDPFHAPPEEGQQKVVPGDGRRATITLEKDQVDVGFRLYLHKFHRKLDPGTSMASHYSSLVDLRDRDDPDEVIKENILITLNEPVNFTDPASGRSYRIYQESFRGPYKPGHPLFEFVVGGTDPRDELFLSWLTVNYDPGRGLKYFGSLLIVAGIAAMFYMKAYFFRPNTNPKRK